MPRQLAKGQHLCHFTEFAILDASRVVSLISCCLRTDHVVTLECLIGCQKPFSKFRLKNGRHVTISQGRERAIVFDEVQHSCLQPS